jgi:excisionase family DNA binding protein
MSPNVARHALVTRRELADLLRVSVRTVDRHVRRGVLEPVQLVPGGRVCFRAADVARLIRGR